MKESETLQIITEDFLDSLAIQAMMGIFNVLNPCNHDVHHVEEAKASKILHPARKLTIMESMV